MSQVEEADDSIVPSTPTLVIPKVGTDQVAIRYVFIKFSLHNYVFNHRAPCIVNI